MFGKIIKYIREVKVELQHATWPWDPQEKGFKKYKELVDSTIVVFIALLLLGAYVSFNDLLMLKFQEIITNLFR